jgi:hypothetical protein
MKMQIIVKFETLLMRNEKNTIEEIILNTHEERRSLK